MNMWLYVVICYGMDIHYGYFMHILIYFAY